MLYSKIYLFYKCIYELTRKTIKKQGKIDLIG